MGRNIIPFVLFLFKIFYIVRWILEKWYIIQITHYFEQLGFHFLYLYCQIRYNYPMHTYILIQFYLWDIEHIFVWLVIANMIIYLYIYIICFIYG